IYPVWHVLCASFSDANLLMHHKGALFIPQGFSSAAYVQVSKNPMILKSYLNTIFIVFAGVTINMALTSMTAYVLSRKNVYFKKLITVLIVVTMYVSGGTIPFYFLVKGVGLEDSLWSVILPTAINTYNLIILKSSFASIPDSMEESARLDGAGHMRILFSIILPLARATVAVVVLYYAVEHWNSWFNAVLFLNDREKYPLQLILREILIQNDTSSMSRGVSMSDQFSIAESIKYAVTIVATVPILCVYPFLQKYFASGVMQGAVKG
ncbi:MAG: carbohydrate ABC transporter permease, partial [Ruminococcaceae bacterium]|nr:carbohydrate ABC transporter permease [Oscillospiraceae bacterium]